MASAPPQPETRRIGRFEIVRALGQGAQGTVFLARDTRLDRTVALKSLRLEGLDAAARARRVKSALDEARLASQLAHPNIVTLHDALEDRGAPCLVFEHVEGRTLADLMQGEPLPAARAVRIALDVLRGLEAAHDKGIVHRDLKPANILITPEGTARVMDFGIARRFDDAETESGWTGTPGYLAPEYLDTRKPAPSNDLFALAVTLHELLTGRRLLAGGQVFEHLHRIAHGGIPRPSEANAAVDARLDAIVMKALSADPAARYPDAARFAAALLAYLDPAGDGEGAGGTLDFLLRRMRHKSDLPALASTVMEVNRALASDREPASRLCDAILRDFSLTNKLLRLVNAALYSQFGGSIHTVSRAVAILGFENVRAVALGLTLVEHLQSKPQAAALREEIASAYFAGVAARELSRRLAAPGAEEAFVCGMFHRLGRLLVLFYLEEEAQAVKGVAEARGIDEHRASREVLGISYEQLGLGVARQWNFPEAIVATLPALRDEVVTAAQFTANPRQAIAELACELTAAAAEAQAAVRDKRLAAVASRFRGVAGIDREILAQVCDEARQLFARDAAMLGLSASRLAAGSHSGPAPAADPIVEASRLDQASTVAEAPERASAAARRTVLAEGVQDITQVLAGEFALNDVLRIILETAYRGIGFDRVLLFIRDAKGREMRCRLGLGDRAAELVAGGLAIPLAGPRDVFSASLREGADLCIADTEAPRIRDHVPAWFRARVPARGMVLLPILVNKRAVGLMYADAADPARLAFEPEELSLLKTLRNQAVLAVRSRS